MNIITIILTLIGFRTVPTGVAIPEAVITYKVTMEFDSTYINPETALVKYYRLSFNEDYIKGEQVGEDPNNFTIINRKLNQKRHFSNFFGKKYELLNKPGDSLCTKVEWTNETDKIAGLSCRKAMVTRGSLRKATWVSHDFNVSYPSYVSGLALEYSVPHKHGYRTYQLHSVDIRPVDPKIFEVDGFEPIDYQDFYRKTCLIAH